MIEAPWRSLLLFLLFVALWLLQHPYWGIMHDGVLYTNQALKHLYPENFARDIFFLYGSQDDYTLFSPVYAKLIKYFGLGEAARLITFFGTLLWCYAIWRFASFWPGATRWLFLFLAALLPLKYGGNEIFAVAESYPVPRLWADALVLLASALWLEKRHYLALAFWGMAALMHPLMALAGLAFVFFYELHLDRRWMFAVAAGVLAICGLALMNVSLFGRLFQAMDPVWLDLVYQRTSLYMFPTAWGAVEYNVLIFHAAVLLWAAWLAEDARLKRIFIAACATGLSGWVVAVVGGDWLHSVLVLQVQPWRLLWLMYVVGWGAVAWLVPILWKPARFAVLGLVAAWFLREYSGGLVLLLVLVLYWQRAKLGSAIIRWLEGIFSAAILLYLVWTALDASTAYLAVYPEDELSVWETLLTWRDAMNEEEAVLPLAAGLLAYWLWRWKKKPALGVFFVFVIFLAYGKNWDMRGTELRNLENGKPWLSTPFNRHIPPDATVYWLDGLQPTWLLLARSSYFSQHQAAGMVFSQTLTKELYRRYLQVKPLGGKAADFRLMTRREAFLDKFDENSSSRIEAATLPALHKACEDPLLDYVILTKRHDPWVIATWYTPYVGSGFGLGLGDGIYLYSCATLRKN